MVVKPEDEMEKSSYHLLQCYFVCECKERQKRQIERMVVPWKYTVMDRA